MMGEAVSLTMTIDSKFPHTSPIPERAHQTHLTEHTFKILRLRDLARKSAHDPLTSINSQLSSSSRSLSIRDMPSNGRRSRAPPIRSRRSPSPRARTKSDSRPPEVTERITRESSERQRALELIRRKKREMAGSETPSTVHGGMDGGYGDVFNRREVEEAHRHRERRWDRNDDRGRRRDLTRW